MDFKNSSNVAVFTTLDGVGHTMIVGGSGNAKSALLMAEARRRGISYEELEKQMQPSPEQIEAARERESLVEAQEAKCLAAVCEAYWANTPLESSSLQQLHDILVVTELAEEPTPAQVKALLLHLPAHVIGQGIAWGFEDTDVRSHVYEHIEENMEAISAAILAAVQEVES
ncbi:hypothetical protein BZK31_07700 [Pseudomonas floridensis]|uniref:Uncharacterized protein n=1 Tax=Pseudomonas floridensis TaxID=1958950 RepID=A0A1X0N8G6_9PSED|nr:hypothetical protein [Pseudomonas floridensis]MEE4126643.1 hypothetical protein [Pseudomonas viridiflava]MEE4911894.1 hypothetical protein [Pseudomonas alliivorans]ORC60190.1 hypothetical protein BZK31_07700 [Pseudomonas floridensis]